MSTDFHERDLEALAPGVYDKIRRLSKIGTTGIVFFAVERASGRQVAIKISRAEDDAVRALRAEAAALEVPEIAQEAEPTKDPTARQLYKRLSLSNRVGLVLEWLDDSFVSVETLVRGAGTHLTELQVLRIVAPFTRLLTVAHAAGYLYVDIGRDKADHLWWREHVVDERPARQVKVIDWANSINMAEMYDNRKTPADDIRGVGELLFYMWQGPHVEPPASASDLVQSKPGTIGDIIRKALFDEDDAFFRKVYTGLTIDERRDFDRIPELRSIATDALDQAIRDRHDALQEEYPRWTNVVDDAITSLEAAATLGLLQLNREIQAKLETGDQGQDVVLSPTDAAKRLLDKLNNRLEEARKIDPDAPTAPFLAARLERLLLEQARLENTRRLLFKLDPQGALRQLGPEGSTSFELVTRDLPLLRAIATALEEVPSASPVGLDPDKDPLAIKDLLDNALDFENPLQLDPPPIRRAYDAITDLDARWGSSRAMSDLRRLIGFEAGILSMADEVRRLRDAALETQRQAADAATNQARPAWDRQNAKDTAENLGKLISNLDEALAQFAPHIGSSNTSSSKPSELPNLPTLHAYYTALRTAVSGSLKIAGVGDHGSRELAERLDRLVATLDSATTALNEGNLEEVLHAFEAWAALDPVSTFQPRYYQQLHQLQERNLDRRSLAIQASNAGADKLNNLLVNTERHLAAISRLMPATSYLQVLNILIPIIQPVAKRIQEIQKQRATSGIDEHLSFAHSVTAELVRILRTSLVGDMHQPSPTLPPASSQLLQVTLSDAAACGEALAISYHLIDSWCEPAQYRLSARIVGEHLATELQARLGEAQSRLDNLPLLNQLTNLVSRQATQVFGRHATNALKTRNLLDASYWLKARNLLTQENATQEAEVVATFLAKAEKALYTHGPATAQTQLQHAREHVPGAREYQADLKVVLDALAAQVDGQAHLLTRFQQRAKQVNLVSLPEAISQLQDGLADLMKTSQSLDKGIQTARGGLPRRSLQQDLEPLCDIWQQTLPRSGVQVGSGSGSARMPVAGGYLRNLASQLEQVQPIAKHVQNQGPIYWVRSEIIEAIYKPLAAALRTLAQSQADGQTRPGSATQMSKIQSPVASGSGNGLNQQHHLQTQTPGDS